MNSPATIIQFFFSNMLLIMCITPTSAWSSAGDLDSSFGNGGKITTEISTGRDVGSSVVLQSDGKIVVAGWSDGNDDTYKFAIVLYNSNGLLDNIFGKNGIVITKIGTLNSQAFSVIVQTDGMIVAVGTTNTKETDKDIAVVRYNTNGTLDGKFGTGGIATMAIGHSDDEAYGIAVRPNGKIVVAGSSRNVRNVYNFAVVQFNADGTIDVTFGTGG